MKGSDAQLARRLMRALSTMAENLATMRDRRYMVAEDRDGLGLCRTSSGFASPKRPSVALCVYDSQNEFDAAIWHKDRFAVWTGRRHLPRTLFMSKDIDAATEFARSAGMATAAMDRNEHQRVSQTLGHESDRHDQDGEAARGG